MSATEHPSGLHVATPDLSRSRPTRWAWMQRLALGYLSLLLGNEGVGKGVLLAWMLARLTRGELPGELRGEPVTVGLIADEDSFDDIWTPRLHVAGADLTLIRHIARDDGWTVDLGEDRDRLRLAAGLEGLRVLYLDALLDNLGAAVDDWRSKQVRGALQPLRALARDFDLAAIVTLHPNKRGESFRQLVSGASAFNQVARASLLLAQHPDDEDRRVLVRGKGNYSRLPPAVEFDIESVTLRVNEHTFDLPRAANLGESDLTADELIDAGSRPAETSSIRDACEIIDALLPRDGDWHPAAPIYEACSEQQIGERTVQRAAKRLHLERRRRPEFKAAMSWRWPTADTHPSRVGTVGSVGSDASSTPDTHDTHDTVCTPPRASGVADNAANGHDDLPDGWTIEDAEALAAEFQETV